MRNIRLNNDAFLLRRALFALMCALPAGLGIAQAAVRVAPSAVRAVPGGGFSLGAAAGANATALPSLPLSSVALPTLPGIIQPSLSLPNAQAAASIPTANASVPFSVETRANAVIPSALAGNSAAAATAPALTTGAGRAAAVEASAPRAGAEAAPLSQDRKTLGRKMEALSLGVDSLRKVSLGSAASAREEAGKMFNEASDKPSTEPDFKTPEPAAVAQSPAAEGRLSPPAAKEAAAPAEKNEAPLEALPEDLAARLPKFLRTAEKKDLEWLVGVYEAAQKSKTARMVLTRIEELTGGGHTPVIMEVVESHDRNEAYFHYDWQIIRFGAHMTKWKPEQSVPTFIHELTHVLQKADGLPVASVELELEAFLNTFKVAHELGLAFKMGHAYLAFSRTFKRSYDAFIAEIFHNYDDSAVLMNATFADFEKKLLRDEAVLEKQIAEHETHVARSERALKALERLGWKPQHLRGFKREQIESYESAMPSWEASLAWTRQDLVLLRTYSGRKRFLDFARTVLKDSRAFQRIYSTTKTGRAKAVRLPSDADALAFKPSAKEDLPRTAEPEIDAAEPDLTGPIVALTAEGKPRLEAALAALKRSPTGERLLEALAARAAQRGRPFAVDFWSTGEGRTPGYNHDYDVVEVPRRASMMPDGEAAAHLAMALSTNLVADITPLYALEFELEGYVTGVAVARELKLKLKPSSILHVADKMLRRAKYETFIEWVQKRHPRLRPSNVLTEKEFSDTLERLIADAEKRIARRLAYLRSRRATYDLMREVRHPRPVLRTYRVDEIEDNELKNAEDRAKIAQMGRDLELLGDEEARNRYFAFAADVLARGLNLHKPRASRAKPQAPSPAAPQ